MVDRFLLNSDVDDEGQSRSAPMTSDNYISFSPGDRTLQSNCYVRHISWNKDLDLQKVRSEPPEREDDKLQFV